MIPGRVAVRRPAGRKPRASGDDPTAEDPARYPVPVNPARAGMIPAGSSECSGAGCKPRASGDDPRLVVVGLMLAV